MQGQPDLLEVVLRGHPGGGLADFLDRFDDHCPDVEVRLEAAGDGQVRAGYLDLRVLQRPMRFLDHRHHSTQFGRPLAAHDLLNLANCKPDEAVDRVLGLAGGGRVRERGPGRDA